jgi:hypothetical protein
MVYFMPKLKLRRTSDEFLDIKEGLVVDERMELAMQSLWECLIKD